MGSLNGRTRDAESRVVDAQATAASCLAKAIVLAFDVCAQERAPLSQAQKAAIVESALLEFDGFEKRLGLLASVGELLRRWPSDARGDWPSG